MDCPVGERKDRYIKIPSTVILTKEGVDIVSASRVQLVKLRNYLGVQRDGIKADSINAQTLQKMVMNSYVEEVSCSVNEFLSYRHEIMSLNSLIVFAIFYKKLGPVISEMFFQSAVVRDFNRKNPKNAIVSLEDINRKTMEEILRLQKNIISEQKAGVSDLVLSIIKESHSISEEDRQVQSRCLDKFINWIDLRIWYVYSVICKTGLADEMKNSMADIIAKYLNRTQIATHLSNLVMELSQNAERAHFERVCVRSSLTKPGQIAEYLRIRENRDTVAMISETNNEHLAISWNMNPDRNAIGQQYKIKISISNYGLMDETTKNYINKKLKTNVDGMSIADFYGTPDGIEKTGFGMGHLYNSYLENYCRDQGIVYRCNIVHDAKLEKATIIIDISL